MMRVTKGLVCKIYMEIGTNRSNHKNTATDHFFAISFSPTQKESFHSDHLFTVLLYKFVLL